MMPSSSAASLMPSFRLLAWVSTAAPPISRSSTRLSSPASRASWIERAAAGVGTHHAQDVALRPRIFLWRDLGIADLDQGLAAIAPENVGNSPNGEADDEQAHQDHAEQAARTFSQIIK